MAQVLFPGRRFTDTNGNPINGGLMYVYEAGTTTPLDTYTDSALTTAADNPIVLDSAGLIPVRYAAPDEYKFVLRSSDDATTYFTIDNFTVIDPTTATAVTTTSITTNTTVAADDLNRLFSVDTSSGAITITADSATLGSGFEFSVVKITSDANAVTITGTGSQVINGAATYNLDSQYDSATFRSNGAGGWDILSQTLDTTTLVADNAKQRIQVALHCGRFEYASATVCTFMPYKGNYVNFPNGDLIAIGASGISSTYNNATINGTAGQTLSASTFYYAYVYNNSGSLVIDWSTTGYTLDTATGIAIKTGDATRVLVGAAYANASSQFDDSATKRNVISWNNRRRKNLLNKYTVDRTYSTSSWGEINSEIRVEFSTWGEDAATLSMNCILENIAGGVAEDHLTSVTLDGNTTPTSWTRMGDVDITNSAMSVSMTRDFAPTVGRHYATIMANALAGSVDYASDSELTGTVIV